MVRYTFHKYAQVFNISRKYMGKTYTWIQPSNRRIWCPTVGFAQKEISVSQIVIGHKQMIVNFQKLKYRSGKCIDRLYETYQKQPHPDSTNIEYLQISTGPHHRTLTSPPIPRTPKILFGPRHPNKSFSQLLFPPPILENAHRTNLRVLGFHQRDPQG